MKRLKIVISIEVLVSDGHNTVGCMQEVLNRTNTEVQLWCNDPERMLVAPASGQVSSEPA